jgi:hypothetical protein
MQTIKLANALVYHLGKAEPGQLVKELELCKQ